MTQPIKLTDAQVQAYALRGVADHLHRHPGLPTVHVSPWRPRGRIRISLSVVAEPVSALLMWAGSLGVDTLTVERHKPFGCDHDGPHPIELHALGRLTGQLGLGHRYVVEVDVYADIGALIPSRMAHGDQIALADLMVACAQPGDLAAALAAVQGGDSR